MSLQDEDEIKTEIDGDINNVEVKQEVLEDQFFDSVPSHPLNGILIKQEIDSIPEIKSEDEAHGLITEIKIEENHHFSEGTETNNNEFCSSLTTSFSSVHSTSEHSSNDSSSETHISSSVEDNTISPMLRNALSKESNKNICNNCYREFASTKERDAHFELFFKFSGCFKAIKLFSSYKRQFISSYIINSGSVFKCSFCDFSSLYRQDMQLHIVAKHKQLEMRCAICAKTFTTIQYLKKHVRYIHNPNPYLYECNLCPFKTKDRHTMKLHFGVHSDKNIQCSVCPHKVRTQNDLKKHIFKKHLARSWTRIFKCSLCSYVGREEENLKQHVRRRHEKGNFIYLHCAECSYKTPYRSPLISHIQVKHMADDPSRYSCNLCSYSTNLKQNLSNHKLITHSTSKSYFFCQQCDFKTLEKDIFFEHINLHNNKPALKCQECSFVADNKTEFKCHVYQMHDPLKLFYYCAYCTYKGNSKTTLINHFIFHHNSYGKKFKCKHCKFATKTNELLKRHVNTKHNPNAIVYYCSHCTYLTKIKPKLGQHMQEKHCFISKKKKIKCS